MQALKAHVVNGRIVIDEPTNLPDGTELYLVPLEEHEGELDDEERERLHAKLREGFEAIQAGRTVPAEKLRTKLLSRP
jgi:hypothetical protein